MFLAGDSSLRTEELALLSGIDRVVLNAHIETIRSNEHKAVYKAQFYRNAWSELSQKYLHLKAEAHERCEGVQYFWRNQILEGSTRSGRIVKAALENGKHHGSES